MLGIERKLSFPEDYGTKDSHEHFMKRLGDCVAEWTSNPCVEFRDVDELPQLMGDDEVMGYQRFKKWLGIFEPDVLGFLEFIEGIYR